MVFSEGARSTARDGIVLIQVFCQRRMAKLTGGATQSARGGGKRTYPFRIHPGGPWAETRPRPKGFPRPSFNIVLFLSFSFFFFLLYFITFAKWH
jgi:hypothetical protein